MKFEFDYQCDIPWERMQGKGCKRFCESCEKHVHHISHLTRSEARAFLERHDWQVCVDFFTDEHGHAIFAESAPKRPLLFNVRSKTAAVLASLPMILAACDRNPEPDVCAAEAEAPISLETEHAALVDGFDSPTPRANPKVVRAIDVSKALAQDSVGAALGSMHATWQAPLGDEAPKPVIRKPIRHLRGRIAPPRHGIEW